MVATAAKVHLKKIYIANQISNGPIKPLLQKSLSKPHSDSKNTWQAPEKVSAGGYHVWDLWPYACAPQYDRILCGNILRFLTYASMVEVLYCECNRLQTILVPSGFLILNKSSMGLLELFNKARCLCLAFHTTPAQPLTTMIKNHSLPNKKAFSLQLWSEKPWINVKSDKKWHTDFSAVIFYIIAKPWLFIFEVQRF